MAITVGGGGSGSATANLGQAHAGNFRDVYGFDNGPDATGLPDVYAEEVGRYGDRTINNFLRMVSAEMGTNSKRVQWGEEGRLNVYTNRARRANAAANIFTINNNDGSATTVTANAGHSFRINDKVIIGDSNTSHLGYVSGASGATITVQSYLTANSTDDSGFPGLDSGTTNLTILVVGSEEQKGGTSRAKTIQPEFLTFTNDTIIIRDTYSINGSDSNQIGWLKSNGSYYWHIKGRSDAAMRFENQLETALVEDKKATTAAEARTASSKTGSEGLFAAIRDGGNVTTGGFTDGGTAEAGRDDFDAIIRRLDKEGAIEENSLWLDRTEGLSVDDILSSQNSYGSGGSSWGLFNNSEAMGLSLGFDSWRRGGYDFYKTSWKYLNTEDGRGNFTDIKGVSVPMGMKNVYDQMGVKMSMPYLHIKYLAGDTGSRKMMSWAHGGSAEGGYSSGVDETRVEMLSERCLCTLGRNNFFLFT